MQPFTYLRANSVEETLAALRDPNTRCLAGGTNLLDLMKGGIDNPVRLVVEVRSAGGTRRIPIAEFHRLPGTTPERDTNLNRDELITAVLLPPSRFTTHIDYIKVRDRASYAFALVSVAAAVNATDGRVKESRIVLGGVAHKPWRAEAAEQALAGQALNEQTIAAAADAAVRGAQPLRDNAFKVALARRAVARALQNAGAVA